MAMDATLQIRIDSAVKEQVEAEKPTNGQA